ncbi:MAG: DUF6883 domain-containing protein, partial [Planctomycetota bacterium]
PPHRLRWPHPSHLPGTLTRGRQTIGKKRCQDSFKKRVLTPFLVIANGMDSVKGILPQSLWDQLAPIRKKIDDFLAPVKGIWPGSTTAESVTLKLRTYLLDLNHVAGKDKATWFQKALGFTQSNLDDLAKQIKFDPAKAIATELTQHGQKYEQIIEIVGANGRRIPTLFVWIKNNDGIVRLVTSTLGAN